MNWRFPDRHLRARLIAVFVVGFVTLSLEIAYTRIISFKLFYYYTYFVIGLALLGMGVGSAIVSLSTRLRRADPLAVIARIAPITAVAGVVTYLVVARLATTTDQIWTGGIRSAIDQIVRLLGLSISLTVVFAALGIMLASLIVAEAHEVRRLYFWDLAGAALACLVAVPLQYLIGPPVIVATCMVVVAGLGIVVGRGRVRVVAATAAAGVVVLASFASGVSVRPDTIKTLHADDRPVVSSWGPVFRVDVIDLDGFSGHQVLIHDGLWGSAIWRYDGTPATTGRFEVDSRRIAFDMRQDPVDRVLIIGAAGGNEIQASLTYGAAAIDAVELNPVTVDLLKGRFNEYSGGIATRPEVNYVRGDGRTFLARSDDAYDIIWFVAPDSYAASNAASSGAFVLSESYLYTEEMIREAWDHLDDDGFLVVQFGDFDFVNKPNRTARYLVTARSALAADMGEFADHTALVVDDGESDLARLSTIIIGRQVLDDSAIDRLVATVDDLAISRLVYAPGIEPEPSITTAVIEADDSRLDALLVGYPYDISTITDDRPFFWHFTPFAEVIGDWSRGIEDTEIAIGERLLLVLLLISVVVAALLLWAPFVVTRNRGAETMPRRGSLFVYFAALGLGFMFVEISMIQRFALLLGYPTLSLSVSLFTILIATAFGARWSGWVRQRPQQGLAAAVGSLAALSVVYLVVSDPLTEFALGWDPIWRIVAVIVLLFPVGVMLGVFLPFGVDLAVAAAPSVTAEGRLVAWCWAVNGFFSVAGALLTTIVSMTFGFNRTLMLGVGLYVVAAAVAGRVERVLRRADDDASEGHLATTVT